MTTALPFQAQQPAFSRMGDLANYANMTFEQQQSYMRSLDTYRTVIAAEKFTYEKALAKGLAEGRAEGRAEGIMETALKMVQKGFDVADSSKTF